MEKIVTRFAPSPTGFLHVGGARTALFNYLFTKQNKGKIILRIEDTDKERNRPEYADGIIRAFEWLGLSFDETLKQSDNLALHRQYLEKLIKDGSAFVSKEEPKEEGQRSEVIRFKNPNKEIIFEDIIKGKIRFHTAELGDFVIAKSVNEPIFHFANVVDDISSGITHVIRGEEHLSNTPRQILIWEAIGERPRPVYGHIPLILSKEREKISKRKHGEMVSVEYYKDRGYLPEALINFLAFLGWNPGGTEEIFSLAELVEKFDIKKVQKGGAIFNPEKLDWYNREYIRRLPKEKRIEYLRIELGKAGIGASDTALLEKIEPVIAERISKWSDIKTMAEENELRYLFEKPKWKKEDFLWKGVGQFAGISDILIAVSKIIENLPEEDFSAEKIKEAVWPFAEKTGRGETLWPTRYALSGLKKSPDPFVISSVIGKREAVGRLKEASEFLRK